MAASGGYWLAWPRDEIFADQSSILGSIGVVSAGFGFAELIARLGIERRVHTAGARKALLDPFRAGASRRTWRVLEEIQHDILGSFMAHVRGAAGRSAQGRRRELFDGEVWTGRRRAGAGLIDGLGEACADDPVALRRGGAAGAGPTRSAAGCCAGCVSGAARLRHIAADDLVAASRHGRHWQRFGL